MNLKKRSKWYEKTMSKRHSGIIDSLRCIASDYNSNVIVRRLVKSSGFFEKNGRKLVLSNAWKADEHTIADFISTFFHELAHQCNYDNYKYPQYHRYNNSKRRAFKLTAWRAELYTDKVAKVLMAVYFPDIPYQQSYTEDRKDWFNKYWGW